MDINTISAVLLAAETNSTRDILLIILIIVAILCGIVYLVRR